MRLTELPKPPLEGALNVNNFMRAPNDVTFLRKRPKNNPQIIKSIEYEYHKIGFTDKGGRFRRRSQEEQLKLTTYAAANGLRVLAPSFVDSKGTNHYLFLNDAKTLDEYLPVVPDEEMFSVVYQLFDDLRKAHKSNIIYGDRWSQNILISRKYGVLHIDFDIEIFGGGAKEFEVAQAVYYTLCAGRKRIIPLLTEILTYGDWFDVSMVGEFVKKHADYFRDSKKYGNAQHEAALLIDEVFRKRLNTKR